MVQYKGKGNIMKPTIIICVISAAVFSTVQYLDVSGVTNYTKAFQYVHGGHSKKDNHMSEQDKKMFDASRQDSKELVRNLLEQEDETATDLLEPTNLLKQDNISTMTDLKVPDNEQSPNSTDGLVIYASKDNKSIESTIAKSLHEKAAMATTLQGDKRNEIAELHNKVKLEAPSIQLHFNKIKTLSKQVTNISANVRANKSSEHIINDNNVRDNTTGGQKVNTLMENDIKTILIWTTYYGRDWSEKLGTGSRMFKRCKHSSCRLTDDKSELSSSNLMLFFHMDNPNFPAVRYPGQLYAHVTMDPPRPQEYTYLDEYEDILNLTVNYRPSADIYNPYSIFVPKDNPSDEVYYPRIPFHKRTKSIAWMVSHCRTNSNRERYVKELRKYINVDIFGKCGNHTCPKDLGYDFCIGQLAQDYKFYLSFENNVCPDYYSEKLINAFKNEMIPIVLGMADYETNPAVAPPHTVINIRDFKGPKELADFLHKMTENEFNEYFQWKRKFVHRRAEESIMCAYCRILHSQEYRDGKVIPSYKQFGGYRKWWQDSCDNDLVSRILDNVDA